MSNDSSSVVKGSTPGVAGSPGTAQAAPKPPRRPRAHWGPVAAIVYSFGAFFGAQIVAYVLLMIGASLFNYDVNDFIETIAGQFAFILLAEAATITAIIGYVFYRQGTLRELGIDRIHLRYTGFALGGYAVYFIAYIAIATAAALLIPSLDINQEQDVGFTDPLGSYELLLTFISLVVLPPLAEEILFRGFMYRGLRARFPFVVAAVLTSLFFAIGHLQFGSSQPLLWIAGIDTFVLSLVLVYAREKTGSIWTGVFIHAIKNAVAFSVLYILK